MSSHKSYEIQREHLNSLGQIWNVKVSFYEEISGVLILFYLYCDGEKFQVVRWQCPDEKTGLAEFAVLFVRLVIDKITIEDFINNDENDYLEMMGEKYARQAYALSESILYSYFNRFFA
ncbi:hypothetical protein [Paenibacillus lutimineralis]|uniref:Uncharacterized protein n=1 Tax=Paenibacillus lutimineralis TaxID=2707005 RepID=A0A3S9UVW3_9BACL|nr:hypothetical protein [Paenibacillus lutimineralis]AZS14187.1 hypothetical protein EI981_06755 [Paenibacillus lutimineralis]